MNKNLLTFTFALCLPGLAAGAAKPDMAGETRTRAKIRFFLKD